MGRGGGNFRGGRGGPGGRGGFSPGPGGRGGMGRGGGFDSNFEDQTTFPVPADKCGLVIGKGNISFYSVKMLKITHLDGKKWRCKDRWLPSAVS